jgi:hypothetical protein
MRNCSCSAVGASAKRIGGEARAAAASLDYMSIDAANFDVESLRDQLKLLADYL